MPRPRKHLSLAEHLNKYESTVLQKALEEMDRSLFWDVFRAFLKVRQREFEIASLDFAGHTGRNQEAAKASGYAQGLEDVAENLMGEMRKFLQGNNGVVEDNPPAE